MADIVIVDYGMANLRSVQKAFEQVGHAAEITSDPNRIAEAAKLVLPGVGAFRDAIARLRETQLAEAITATSAAAGRSWASAWECNCSSLAATRTACTAGWICSAATWCASRKSAG